MWHRPRRAVFWTALVNTAVLVAASILIQVVLGTGWSSGGFCSCVAAPGGALLRLIMLSGAGQDAAKVASYLAHELAVGWLEPDPQRPCAAEDAAVEGAWLALRGARGDELVRGVERQQFEAELRADSLALRWGARRERPGSPAPSGCDRRSAAKSRGNHQGRS